MSIFNSLGSNYDGQFVRQDLLGMGKKTFLSELSTVLGQHYGGKVTLTYKGRQALELALTHSDLPAGSTVGINGFTCYVVYKAVVNAGYKPVFIDTAAQELNFGTNELKQAVSKHANLKAIIVQNTLGYPADMTTLAAYCQQQNILIIEDLAHSTGLTYSNGREAGSVGALTMMSFSQDKPLDVVAGGALIDRREAKAPDIKLPKASLWQRSRNRFYPLWSSLIRTTYPIGLGRYIHFILKRLHLMSTPMSDDLQGLQRMPTHTAQLILERWQDRQGELAHRRSIAAIYAQKLPKSIQIQSPNTGLPTYLRYPLLVSEPTALISFLRKYQIFIGDTWYDAPIGPKKYFAQTDYQPGTCVQAESLAKQFINLPTHRGVTPEIAADICAKIKQWQALQQTP